MRHALCVVRATDAAPILLHYNSQGALSIATSDSLAHPSCIDFGCYLATLENNRLLRVSKLVPNPHIWSVCDTTAGFGKDAYILHQYASYSLWLEKNPIVHALLFDAWHRAKEQAEDTKTQRTLASIKITHADAVTHLRTCDAFDIIYLDPMFTSNKRCAKKPLQMLRMLHQEQTHDTHAELLRTALGKARKKVIVKRHKKDTTLLKSIQPTYSNCAKNLCFDVYITG